MGKQGKQGARAVVKQFDGMRGIEVQLLEEARGEIREIARLTQVQEKDAALARLTELEDRQRALAEETSKVEPKKRAALERFLAFYDSPDEMAAHIVHDRREVMACAEPLGVTSEDIDLFLAAYALALTMRAQRARPPAPQYETTREFVLRLRRESRAKPHAAPESAAAFGQLPEGWSEEVERWLHGGMPLAQFTVLRGHVSAEELQLPPPWPSEAKFAEFSLRRQWEAGGGTIEELQALPEADRSAMLRAQLKGMVQL